MPNFLSFGICFSAKSFDRLNEVAVLFADPNPNVAHFRSPRVSRRNFSTKVARGGAGWQGDGGSHHHVAGAALRGTRGQVGGAGTAPPGSQLTPGHRGSGKSAMQYIQGHYVGELGHG